ncbi:hypothetical protein JRG42_22730 [Pseudomonas granadensis]|uniref:Uncharacterized protein n=1 Tax=Pseudomonas granadensis TaxID=1421430 RepID=A0ABX7GN55_9PSED|nr:hypothetical protein [Pseudomonas granadensis]MBN6807124.1 hypothetical protein [Pseudomonas granadensis]MBN6834028.1 hypothetical protein [Pseudomonas granadensis]MBN6841499.1 hypothetical protein [Pseudomonas granadensis]MBN6870216.1 hypothetical protein [Pseudomonas granadensis]
MQAEVLIQASEIEAGECPDVRDEFTRQQLRRASELVKGAVALGSIENAACLGILSRSVLEQLITVLWGIRSVENAVSQTAAGPAELAKALRMNLKEGTAKIFDRETGEDVTAQYLEREQAKQSRRSKSVQDQAKEAEVQDLYTVFYRLLSLETHGHNETPAGKSEACTLCVTHLQGIGAISRGIGQACVCWLIGRAWPDYESLRDALGLNG